MKKILKHIILNLSIGILVILFFLQPGLILRAIGCVGTFCELWTCGAFCELILFSGLLIVYGLGRAVTDSIAESKTVNKKGKRK